MGPIAKTLVFALFVAVVSAHYHHKFRQTKVTPFSRAMDHYGREMRRLHRDSPELSQEEKQAAANRAASKHVTKIQNPSSVRKHLAQKETLMNLEREATEEEEGVATGFVLPAQSVCEELGLLAEEREGTAEEEEEEVCFPETVDCGKFTRFFRTVDGSCNNVEFPLNGAANTPFPRLLPAFYDPEEPFEGLVGNGAFSFYQLAEAEEERAANRMLGSGLKKLRMSSGLDRSRANLDRRRNRSPEELNELAACEAIFPHNLQSARAVSLSVHIEEIPDGSTDTDDEFDGQVVNSLILMQIGQLIDHDLTLTPETESEACCTLEEQEDENCISIPVQLGDPFTTFNEFTADDNTAECLELTRSTEFCPSEPGQVREQFNAITAWIDASNVYGSSLEQVCNLREFSGGRMAVSSDIVEGEDLLPQVDGAFTAGDIRANEQSGLNAIHTLFVREHNRIADEIASSTEFGDLNDEEIYQVAKRINEVQMQNLVFGENGFVNTVLGDDLYEDFDIDFNGRDRWDDLLSGDIFNVFATAAFRFGHTFIQNFVPFVDPTTLAIEEDVGFDLRDAFFNPDIITENGASVVLTGTLQRNSRTFDAFLTGDLTNNLQPGADQDRSDLAARNIQRGRDHGLAPYNAYREGCGLRPLCDWNDRPDNINEDAWANLEAVYNHPSDIEAFPGLLSEDSVEDGIVGETLGCLLGIQFANLKFADRFYYTFNDGLDGQLTEEMTNAVLAFDGGLTLGNILCQNIPGLVSARVNPFFLDSEELDCSTVTGIDISSFAEAMISSSRK